MKTEVCKITADEEKNEEIFKKAAKVLEAGGLVAFPTETVYGLGAYALDSEVCKKIFEAKGRPSDNPLIVHVSDMMDAFLYGEFDPNSRKLAQCFWPGALTLVVKRSSGIPDVVTGGLDTVAIRVPAHTTANRLLQVSRMPIAAPSANRSGNPSPTTAAHVLKDLDGRIDMLIEDDTVNVGIESTVIDMTSKNPTILRPGIITREQIETVLGEIVTFAGEYSGEGIPMAPGMKYRHYAPEAGLFLVCGDETKRAAKINRLAEEAEAKGQKTYILALKDRTECFACERVIVLGSDPSEAASSLYSALRRCDEEDADVIFAEGFEERGVGLALMNRLKKASGGNIIQV